MNSSGLFNTFGCCGDFFRKHTSTVSPDGPPVRTLMLVTTITRVLLTWLSAMHSEHLVLPSRRRCDGYGNPASVTLLNVVVLLTPHCCFSSFPRAPLSLLTSLHLLIVLASRFRRATTLLACHHGRSVRSYPTNCPSILP